MKALHHSHAAHVILRVKFQYGDQHKDRTLEQCKRDHAQQVEEDLLNRLSSPVILGSHNHWGRIRGQAEYRLSLSESLITCSVRSGLCLIMSLGFERSLKVAKLVPDSAGVFGQLATSPRKKSNYSLIVIPFQLLFSVEGHANYFLPDALDVWYLVKPHVSPQDLLAMDRRISAQASFPSLYHHDGVYKPRLLGTIALRNSDLEHGILHISWSSLLHRNGRTGS